MDEPEKPGFASLYPTKKKKEVSPRKRKIKRLIIAFICLALTVWSLQAYRHHLQSQRKKIDNQLAKQKSFDTAVAHPKELGQSAKLGRFSATLTGASFKADIEHPELHKYLVGTWQLTNPTDTTQNFRVICKAVDTFSNGYIVAVLRDVDLSDVDKTKQSLADSATKNDALTGEIKSKETITFELATDLEAGVGPYSFICEALAADNKVVAWKTQVG